jgi:hypothetical protein
MATRAARGTNLSPVTNRLLDEIGRAGEDAVREVREDNRRRSIPNVHVEDRWIVEELADGSVKRRRKLPTLRGTVKRSKS